MRDLGTIAPKNVLLLRTRERVFHQKTNNGTKWSFSVKMEPIAPSSDSRAEQLGPLSVIQNEIALILCHHLKNIYSYS